MRFYQSQLRGQAVYKGGRQLGRLRSFSMDNATGKIEVAYFGSLACEVTNIIDWNKIELTKDAKIIKYSTPPSDIIKKKVYTKEGHYLGRITDYQIDTDQLLLTQITVRSPWRFFSFAKNRDRLISKSQIYEITNEKVVVNNEEAVTITNTVQPLEVTLY
ncbi:hypothetical protein COV81_03600 [Candidatus Peregrinibacteria bacterium CG11_big_fil_rev_8_21_14_0_20_41_10]|nr:MAG: hypothetical protein COV81_03600 [Candidatus Peregrinibacteria bacterium CG11_big_fil_rev_8_21_14_0_20_41_10]PIZ75059.1 MAG: hypothetical protein COY06_03235 [Candidatus Peregrinibacteria bacterium CG_4_10_14_0_2_um_filter_41_8]PJC38089.1 MAG: hypothetical protein CO045_02075 [Candidatus Peregrinibacteria bacterium CG_4_9_14_0_2_um_filter_41_14]